ERPMAPRPEPKARPTARWAARATQPIRSTPVHRLERTLPPAARPDKGRDRTEKGLPSEALFFTVVVTPGGLEPPAYGLGNRRSILLSYGVTPELLPHFESRFQCRAT